MHADEIKDLVHRVNASGKLKGWTLAYAEVVGPKTTFDLTRGTGHTRVEIYTAEIEAYMVPLAERLARSLPADPPAPVPGKLDGLSKKLALDALNTSGHLLGWTCTRIDKVAHLFQFAFHKAGQDLLITRTELEVLGSDLPLSLYLANALLDTPLAEPCATPGGCIR